MDAKLPPSNSSELVLPFGQLDIYLRKVYKRQSMQLASLQFLVCWSDKLELYGHSVTMTL
jgi:hypothetical protein